jgi:hypothetical protein
VRQGLDGELDQRQEPGHHVDFTMYGAWQRALEEAFFGADSDGHPVVMYIGDEESASLQTRFALDVPLVEAVSRVVDCEAPQPYAAVEEFERSNRSDDGAPAVLPLLACSVIAATRMANDGQHRVSNYHDHLSQLLARRDGVLTSSKYLPIADMWQRLASWQLRWGAYRGLCTIPSPGDLPRNQARIGYALSQAVLNGADRQLLPRFFQVMRQRDSAAWPLPGAVLVRGARLWEQKGRFSAGFRRALEDAEIRHITERLLGNLANVWDGSEVYVQNGAPRAELLVSFESRRLGWLVRLPRLGALEYRLANGARLHRLGDTNYYSTDGVKLPDGGSLRAGVHLLGEGISVSRPASSLVVLRQDYSLDCRTSVDRFVPGEEHMILAAPEAAADVQAVLDLAASPGRRKEAGKLPWMPEGWSLHHGVVFDDAVTLKAAIRRVQGAVLALQPAPQYRAYLQGGLKIAPDLDRSLYLVGAEPDLVLPDGASGEVRLDQQAQEPPFNARGLPIPLWPQEMPAGRHRIEAEGSVMEFATAEAAPSLAAPATVVGFAVEGTRSGAFPAAVRAGTPVATGADFRGAGTGAVPRIALGQRGAEATLFVASDGRVWDIAVPDPPSWWSRLSVQPSDYYFEVELRGADGWLLQRRRGKWTARAAYPSPPRFRPAASHKPWVRAVLDAADACADPLWRSYVSFAQEAEL